MQACTSSRQPGGIPLPLPMRPLPQPCLYALQRNTLQARESVGSCINRFNGRLQERPVQCWVHCSHAVRPPVPRLESTLKPRNCTHDLPRPRPYPRFSVSQCPSENTTRASLIRVPRRWAWSQAPIVFQGSRLKAGYAPSGPPQGNAATHAAHHRTQACPLTLSIVARTRTLNRQPATYTRTDLCTATIANGTCPALGRDSARVGRRREGSDRGMFPAPPPPPPPPSGP